MQDNATPCGNSLAAQALLHLAAYTGEERYRQPAHHALAQMRPLLEQAPTAFANWLCAADFAIGPILEVAIAGEPADELAAPLWAVYRPRMVAARCDPAAVPAAAEGHPPLAQNRPRVGGRPTAYVCRNFMCLQPVDTPDALEALLSQD
jgi:hypothetical protein